MASIITSLFGGGKKSKTPVFNADAQKKKAAEQEGEANKRRVMAESDTIRTSALGNTEPTVAKKKTLLGG